MELPARRSTTLHSGFARSTGVRAAGVARQLIPIMNAVNVSAGFTAHRVNVAEASYGATGAGIKIGVLSDSVDGLAAVQASGDLGPVTVLPEQAV